jgi:hypothetical protein
VGIKGEAVNKARRLSAAAVASVAFVTAAAAMLAGELATPRAGAASPIIVHAARDASAGHARSTTATWAASNWSGYAETGTFASVGGSWTVPAVTAGASTTSRSGRFGRQSTTSSWYSSAWLGIDGFNDSSLIQTGTEEDFTGGAAHYSAWWEILPAAETVIAKPVSAGDAMSATIVETAATETVGATRRSKGTTEHEWSITLSDVTQHWTFTTTQAYGGAGTSAEWVMEAPEVNGSIAALADYAFPAGSAGAGDFNTATVGPTIGAPLVGAGLVYANDAGVMIQNNAQVSTPGPQDQPASQAFNALYGATAPAAPTS